MSESDWVSDEVGSRQTHLFRLYEHSTQADWFLDLVACSIFFLWVASTIFLLVELVIFFAVPPRGIGFRFRLGTGLISDGRRASAEVSGEKLAELNDGWLLVFTIAGWFTGAAFLFSENREKSYGLKMCLSQGKRLFARKPLAAISPVAVRFYAFPNSSPIWYTVTTRPGCERSLFLIPWQYNFFQGPHESFIQGLHFVAAVRWEANDVNMILSS